jgi:hypothetical protein
MSKAQRFPTAIQDITLNLIFAVMDERRFNRMHHEYMAIAARLPPLKKLTFQIIDCCSSSTSATMSAGSLSYRSCVVSRQAIRGSPMSPIQSSSHTRPFERPYRFQACGTRAGGRLSLF